jgi:hypothetical protein
MPKSLDAVIERMDYGRSLKGELLMSSQPWVPYAQPLLDAVSLFESLNLGYALIGGIAAMYYGRSRFTEDVDFVVVTGHMEILAAHRQEMEDHHFSSDCTHKLYHKSGVQVDVWKDEHAEEIISRAVQVQLVGKLIRVIEPHDLIAMKLRAMRLKDDYDVSQIILNTAIDETRLATLVSAHQLKHFTEIKKRA